MNQKLLFATLAAAAMAFPVAGAYVNITPDDGLLRDENGNLVLDLFGLPAPNLEKLLPADFSCENGSHEYTMPYPNDPTMTVTTHLQCPDPNELVITDSDCTGTSWSHWQGPAAQAWTYTVDSTNPFGFSQSSVNSAFNAANQEWESWTSPSTNIYNGYVNGGTGANSGVYDSYILAEFRAMGGQLRNAVGVQWAWASGGKIVHTDAAYNTNYPFALGAVSGKYDLQSIAAHEMGHGYGIGHSNTASSSTCLTVYPYATLNAIHGRTLGDGDIISIQNRY